MSQDWPALFIAFAYVFAMLGIAEGLRRWRGYSVEFTRKFIHIAVGMWAFGTVLLFEHRTFAIIPPLAFVAINALSYWRGMFKAMETGEKGQLGTIYFPISFAVLIWLLWERPHLLVASLMPMTWGDALAAVVGQRIGQRRYTVAGSTRSLEGSVVLFLISWAATLVPLVLLAPEPLDPAATAGAAAVTALGAVVVEAISPWGIDNLTVPAVSALALVLILP
ncbi:MAG: phosphatidate cytidylyltransferase [Chloroflexota bacterium]|nr:MAG: phosphatidate cytidylyltransferase [Chloroflexota bacterium]